MRHPWIAAIVSIHNRVTLLPHPEFVFIATEVECFQADAERLG